MEQLKKCPFCGGENIHSTYFNWTPAIMCECGAVMTVQMGFGTNKEAELVRRWNTRKPMERYEELERKLQSVYGECDGLLETVVEGLVKHEGAEFEKPMKARLLTDEDVDKWDRLKGVTKRIVERLEELREAEYDDSDEEPEYRDFDDIFEEGVSSGKFIAYHKAIEIVKEEMS